MGGALGITVSGGSFYSFTHKNILLDIFKRMEILIAKSSKMRHYLVGWQ